MVKIVSILMDLTEVLSPKSKSENEIYKKTEMYTISTIPKEILKTSGYIFDFTIPVIRNGSSLLRLNLLKLSIRLVGYALPLVMQAVLTQLINT